MVPPPPTWPKLCNDVIQSLHRKHFRNILFALPTLRVVEVHIDISEQDWVHPVREMTKRCHDGIDLVRAGLWDVAHDHVPVLLTYQHLEDYYVGYKGFY